MINEINDIDWETDPLLSFFIDDCDNDFKDLSEGGAIYNNYGFTSVSLSNTVDSLLNLKDLVFDKKRFTLPELNEFRSNNFIDDDVRDTLKNQTNKFGRDNEEVIDLTNDIINHVQKTISNKTTKFGGKFKFGLSSPSYISHSPNIKASFDGRKDFEPFDVHISLDENKDYTELMRFASKIDYSGYKFNGNVVDFMVTPDFINKNFDKFLDFIILSFEMGVFQMQLNVVDSKTLIKAKENPQDYPNLIVRVWGFSAYFKDLPPSYQDLLIKRAIENERKNN
jgi:formate C-acetyltransferase